MGFKVDDAWMREMIAKGLIDPKQLESKGADIPSSLASQEKSKHPSKPTLLPASFTPPATWVIPLYCTPGDNQRGVKIGRAGHERKVVAKHLASHLVYLCPFAQAAREGKRVCVTFTRLGRLLDSDGLQGAMKYARDTVAMFLGVDDGPSGVVEWEYKQEKSAAFGVKVELSL